LNPLWQYGIDLS